MGRENLFNLKGKSKQVNKTGARHRFDVRIIKFHMNFKSANATLNG